MAAPYPASRRVLARTNEGGGLLIRNDDHIFCELHALPILFVVRQEYLLCGSRQLIFAAVQCIMESLRDLEEIVSSRDHIPVGGNFEFSEQGNETIQHFGHSSTDSGGVDHLHCLSLEFASKKAQFVELGRADNCLVVIEVRRRDRSWRCLPGSRNRAPLRTQGRGLSGENRLRVWLRLRKRGRRLRISCSLRFHIVFRPHVI